MKKRTTVLLAAVLFCVGLFGTALHISAVTAAPAPFHTEQPDGTELTVHTYGDEHFHWNEDDSGRLICYQESDRTWYYAELDENNDLVPGSVAAGSGNTANGPSSDAADPRLTFEDIEEIAENKANVSRAANAVALGELNVEESAANAPSSETSEAGVLKNNEQDLLLLLIEYTDVSLYNTIDFWGNRYFGMEGNTVNNYYMDQSGSFNLQFKRINFTRENGTVPLTDTSVIKKIELKNGVAKVTFNKAHPGSNNDLIGADIETAFSYVKNYINFSKYTGSAIYNTFILQEYFQTAAVIAGWEGSASSQYSQNVWAHAHYWYYGSSYDRTQIAITTQQTDMGGVTYPAYSLLSYMVHGELYSGHPSSGNAQTMGVGVSVHEMGHCLGMPDLYDTVGDSAGLSTFSVMAAGSWGAKTGEIQGTTPVGFDAWSKIKLGFAKPTVIAASQKNTVVTLTASSDNPVILKLTSPEDPNQYFLVENRQITGYDAGLEYSDLTYSYNKGGICIYHIDESVITSGQSPNSNNRWHYGVDLLFADGSDILHTGDNRFFEGYAPFFTADGYADFHSDSSARSMFYVPGHTADNTSYYYSCHPKTILCGISLKVLDNSGSSMKVRVNMAEGDLNGDGQVTPADRMLFARYWSWPDSIALNRYAADLNQDKQVNDTDLKIFSRYFAGWPGYTTLPHN